MLPELAIETDAIQGHEFNRDNDLCRRVESFLADSHMPGLRHLHVQAENGVVIISGSVKTYYERQIVQQRAKRVAGVVRLIDKIDVAAA